MSNIPSTNTVDNSKPAETLNTDEVIKGLEAAKGNRLYKSNIKSFNMYTDRGKRIIFVNGMFHTADKHIIEYLDREIEGGLADVFIDQNEMYFDPAKYDPRAAMRNQIIDELIRQGILATDPRRDMGKSEQGKLNAGNSTNIAPVTVGGKLNPASLLAVGASKATV